MDLIQVLWNFRKKFEQKNLILVFLKKIFLLQQLKIIWQFVKQEAHFIFSLYTKFFEYRYSSNLLIYYIDLL